MGTFGIDIIKTDLNGIYENAICGENINKGEICYLGSDQKYYLAKADNISTCSTELRVALEDSLQNNFSKFLISGKINISTSLIPGNLYYISDNISGNMEEDINNISLTSYVRKIGTAYSEYTLEFNPDETVIKKSGIEINKLPLPESSETTKGIVDFPMMREAVASADTVTELLTGDEVLIKRFVNGVPTLFKADKDLFGGGSGGIEVETDPVFSAWLQNASFIPYTGATSNVDLGAHTIALGNEEVNTNYSKHITGYNLKSGTTNYPIYRHQSHYWNGSTWGVVANIIGIGNDAIKYNKGSQNIVGVGSGALMYNTGYNNVAVGTNAGKNNTASSSTFIGYVAGYQNTGNGTIGIGDNSSSFNTAGGTIAIGNYSAYSNTGYMLLAIGASTAQYNKGSDCIFIGGNSGQSNEGNSNLGLGNLSSRYSKSYACIGIGESANEYHTGGFDISVGINASKYATSIYSVHIGSNSGQYDNGTNNVYIGYNTGNFLENTSASKNILDNFSGVDFNNNCIIITNHGFGNTGTYVNLKYTNQYYYNIMPMYSGQIYKFKIIDANTLELQNDYLYDDYSGMYQMDTHTFTPQYLYNNVSCFGYNSKPTKSNQVALGGSTVTEVLIGGTLAIDKNSIVNAASGKPLYVRLVNGVKTITI